MNEGVLSSIGNTPLVRLNHVSRGCDLAVYAKLEALNPGGSIKDRAAFILMKNAIAAGRVRSDTVVVESSSGNMGIGLAQVCAYYGLRFICVVDPKTTAQNIRLLEIYGAEVDMVVEPDAVTGEFLQARLDRVSQLIAGTEHGFWPDQYSNLDNALAHYQTMREIAEALGDEVDYLFCAASTCGTLRGCHSYIRRHGLRTKIIAVDAVGSVIFGGERAKRLVPGHGAALRPLLYQEGLADRCIHITDLECVVGCRRLVQTEAILAGGSSGAVMSALERVKGEIAPGSTCALILPDRGERYLDTIYSDDWVGKYFGEVSHLWEQPLKTWECATAVT
ncbi:MAG TPA: 2,3-diaminopropionate biosynthesis protein SbnA [Pyrinomonadaceae bacterium]|jgi:cysteine synthase A